DGRSRPAPDSIRRGHRARRTDHPARGTARLPRLTRGSGRADPVGTPRRHRRPRPAPCAARRGATAARRRPRPLGPYRRKSRAIAYASFPGVPGQVMLQTVPAAGEQLTRRFTSATVSGTSPGGASRARKGNSEIRQVLLECAWAARTTSTYVG